MSDGLPWSERLWSMPRWRLVGFVMSVALILSLVVSTAWLSEDSYISFRTANNFLEGYGLRWNVAERVQSYTHPLWLFCLIPLYAMIGHVGASALGFSFALCVVNLYLLSRFVARSPHGLFLAVCVLASSRAFIEFSTSGLENPLTFTLLILFVVLYHSNEDTTAESARNTKAPIWSLSIVVGLAMFNRMDTLLLFAPAMLEVLWRKGWTRRHILEASSGAAIIFGWMLFSLVYYGAPFPNTAYAKLGAGIGKLEMVSQGFAYLRESLSEDPATLTLSVGIIVWTMMSGSRRQRALALGISLYLAYVIRIGGDFMSGRFLAAPFLLATCLLATKITQDATRRTLLLAPAVLFVGVMGTYPPLWPAPDYIFDQNEVFGDDGIADERKYYFAGAGLVHAKDLETYPNHPWVQEGRAMRKQNKEAVVVHGNIGFRGYFAGPKVHFVDPLGLTDPLLARLPSVYQSNWRIGHFQRQVPQGYARTLELGENKIANRSISAYYKHIESVTRAPIWSAERWRSIWLLNTRQLDHLIPEATCRFAQTKRIPSRKVQQPIPAGTPWDKSTIIFHENGLCVSMATPITPERLTIAADGNDTLRLYLIKGEEVLGKVRKRGIAKAGVQTSTIEIGDVVDGATIDRVCVFPEVGDGAYSLGQLILE